MYNLLKSKNECLKDELVSLTQKLIRTPSPTLAESGVATLVEEELRRVPCDKVFRDEAGNVVGVLLGRETEPTGAAELPHGHGAAPSGIALDGIALQRDDRGRSPGRARRGGLQRRTGGAHFHGRPAQAEPPAASGQSRHCGDRG